MSYAMPATETIASELLDEVAQLYMITPRRSDSFEMDIMRRKRQIQKGIRNLIQANPEDGYAVQMTFASALGDVSEIHHSYRVAYQYLQDVISLVQNYAVSLHVAGESEEAVKVLREHTRELDGNVTLRRYLASFLIDHGRFQEASEVLKDILQYQDSDIFEDYERYCDVYTFLEDREIEQDVISSYMSLVQEIVREEHLCLMPQAIGVVGDGDGKWLSIVTDTEGLNSSHLAELNERIVDDALDAELPPAVLMNCVTRFV